MITHRSHSHSPPMHAGISMLIAALVWGCGNKRAHTRGVLICYAHQLCGTMADLRLRARLTLVLRTSQSVNAFMLISAALGLCASTTATCQRCQQGGQ